MDNQRILSLANNLNEHIKALTCNADDRARQDAMITCSKLLKVLESPGETIVRMTWHEPAFLAVLKVATDIFLFQHLQPGDENAQTSAELAAKLKMDPILMSRIMKSLAAMGAVIEVRPDAYASDALAQAMCRIEYQEALTYMYNVGVPTNLKTASYFATRGYSNPVDSLEAPVQFWHDPAKKIDFFGIMNELNCSHGLAQMMRVWHTNRPHWSDESFYPVKERLILGAESDDSKAVFIVDVGGSHGVDLQKFVDRHPFETFPGRLIIQDLPEVIQTIPDGSIVSEIEPTVHDFFNSQPVEGARVYFLHSILHDHPDDRAKRIVQQIARSMRRGYSKLLIWEFVLPNFGATPMSAALDWLMMTFFAAGERSEAQWKKLLEDFEVGLKVNGVWTYSQFDQSVIEAELA